MNKINNKPPGRPREHNREQIAIDLIEWAKKQDSINLCKFCALYDPPIAPSKLANWSKEDDNFRQAVEIAKSFLGYRREEWLNAEMLHVKGYDLNATTYDYFLKEEKRAQAEFENSLKVKETVMTNEEDKQRAEALMSQLSRLQSSFINSCSKSNTEVKS